MIQEDLIAERISFSSYSEMIQYFGDDDVTTRKMQEMILITENNHANYMVAFLEKMNSPRPKVNRGERSKNLSGLPVAPNSI
jgi:bacterioferritin (cytochrome b1)